jgi:hypothetical protein
MPRLRSLELCIDQCGGIGSKMLRPLCAAAWFSQLQELSLKMEGFGSRGLAPLRSAPLLRKLSISNICGGPPALTAADGRALAAAALPELRELQILSVGPSIVAALATAPWFGQLESLHVTGVREGQWPWPLNRLSAADGRALAAAHLPSIKRLNIDRGHPGFMAACAAAAWLSRLECLTLRGEDGLLGGGGGLPEGSAAWPAAPFTALVSLTLSYFETSKPAPAETSRFAALVAAPWFGRLQQLHLRGFPLGSARGSDGAGVRALAAASLPNLTSLSLHFACLSGADVSGVLSSAPWLSHLTSLDLLCNHLGAPGHLALSLLPMPRLRHLDLCRNGFDATSLAALVSAPWLTQLAGLSLIDQLFAPPQICENIMAAIANDAWVFGRLRRLGCTVAATIYSSHDTFDNATTEPSSDDETASGDETGSGGEPGSDPGGDG